MADLHIHNQVHNIHKHSCAKGSECTWLWIWWPLTTTVYTHSYTSLTWMQGWTKGVFRTTNMVNQPYYLKDNWNIKCIDLPIHRLNLGWTWTKALTSHNAFLCGSDSIYCCPAARRWSSAPASGPSQLLYLNLCMRGAAYDTYVTYICLAQKLPNDRLPRVGLS